MNKDFIERIKNMGNYTYTPELPEFSKDIEYRARKIIEDMDKRYRNNIVATMKGDSTIIHVRENNYDGRKVIQFQARTSGCNMKKCGSCWNCNYGIKEKSTVTPDEYVKEFEILIDKYEGDTMVMEAMGSVTDRKEFPREALLPIIDIALEKGRFKSLTLETHITQIDEELVSYIHDKNLQLPEDKRKRISFEVGIEDFNSENRILINKKGVTNEKIKQVYNMLDKYGIELDINLIYGFPFQTEDERIEAMAQNIKYAKKNLPNAGLILFLMSIKDNTIMEHMHKTGHYKLPNPWGFVEIAKIAVEEAGENYIGFSWFGEKEDPVVGQKKAYCCPNCQKLIVNSLKEINKIFNKSERKKILDELLKKAEGLDCKHYQDFQKELETIKNYKRKTSKRRLNDYYEDIINAETGAKIEHPYEPEL